MEMLFHLLSYLKDTPYRTEFRETKANLILRDLERFKTLVSYEDYKNIESFIRKYFTELLQKEFGSLKEFYDKNNVSDTLQISLTKNYPFLQEDLFVLFSSLDFSSTEFYTQLYTYLL